MGTVEQECAACEKLFTRNTIGRPAKYCSTQCRPSRNNTPNESRACSIDGCTQSRYQARSICSTHAMRKTRYGDVNADRSRIGRHWSHSAGYVLLGNPAHPLADQQGAIYEHRMVLYARIGAGVHGCHWCQTPVEWMVDLEADHLNSIRDDNRSENLVPSCHACNTRRALDRRWHHRGSHT